MTGFSPKQTGLPFPEKSAFGGQSEMTLEIANFRCWLRVNGENVPDSNVLLNLFHVDVKDVIISQGLVHLNAGDVIQVIMATDNAAAGIGAAGFADGLLQSSLVICHVGTDPPLAT